MNFLFNLLKNAGCGVIYRRGRPQWRRWGHMWRGDWGAIFLSFLPYFCPFFDISLPFFVLFGPILFYFVCVYSVSPFHFDRMLIFVNVWMCFIAIISSSKFCPGKQIFLNVTWHVCVFIWMGSIWFSYIHSPCSIV